jgi:hypothetical protein
MMDVKLIFSNKSSVLNKKLIKFFQMNLFSLNKSTLVFKFEVADPDNMEQYTDMGVKNYPTLIHNGDQVAGVEKIISYLKSHVDKYNLKIMNKSPTDRVDDFWKQTLGKVSVDDAGKIESDDDEDDEDNDLHKKIHQAFQDRNETSEMNKKPKTYGRTSNVAERSAGAPNHTNRHTEETPADTIKKNRKRGGDMDDELMAKFFENQQES